MPLFKRKRISVSWNNAISLNKLLDQNVLFWTIDDIQSMYFAFRVPCCDVRCDFHIVAVFTSSLPPVVCRRLISYVVCVCLIVWVMSNTYCVVFLFCFSSSCVPCVVWIVHFWLRLRYSLVFIQSIYLKIRCLLYLFLFYIVLWRYNYDIPYGDMSGFIFQLTNQWWACHLQPSTFPRAVEKFANTRVNCFAYDWTVKDEWKCIWHDSKWDVIRG